MNLEIDNAEILRNLQGLETPERIAGAVAALVAPLIVEEWQTLAETWAEDEDAKIKLSVGVTLQGAMTAPKVCVNLAFARKYATCADIQLEDPNQPELL
jgi:hypothetical protein